MGFVNLLKNIFLGIENNIQHEENMNPPMHELIMLYSPDNEIDLALIKGILDGEGIPYFVHNEHFGSLKVGPQIPLFNQKTLMVDDRYKDHAASVIKNFLENTKPETARASGGSWPDKIRVIMEAFICGWFMPGRVWDRNNQDPSKRLPKDDWLPILINTLAVTLIVLAFILICNWVVDLITMYFGSGLHH